MFERIVLVTRKTRMQELVERYMSRAQARFVIERAGGDFASYEVEDGIYRAALARSRQAIDLGLKVLSIDRHLVPTLLFTEHDLVVAIGQDGLVANVAKYAHAQPIIGVNPDPERIDGILLPWPVAAVRSAVTGVLESRAAFRDVTLAKALLADGQQLLAFNDLFIGPRSHTSARYRIRWGDRSETQSSSGILVSTGAGSTGWLSSVYAMASGISRFAGGPRVDPVRLAWEDPRLVFAVREPFVSRHSSADVTAGFLEAGQELTIESLMPSGGVIFSDGIEADYLRFDAGCVARVAAFGSQAHLVVPGSAARRPDRGKVSAGSSAGASEVQPVLP